MAWAIARFDGAGLVLAGLTRRHPGLEVRQALGPPRDHVYPSASRIVGLGRMHGWMLVRRLRRRLGRAVEVRWDGDDLLVRAGIPLERVQNEELRLVMVHEHHFHPPLLLYRDGRVLVHLRGRPGVRVAELVARMPGLDVRVVPRLDLAPWAGLEPLIVEDGRFAAPRVPTP